MQKPFRSKVLPRQIRAGDKTLQNHIQIKKMQMKVEGRLESSIQGKTLEKCNVKTLRVTVGSRLAIDGDIRNPL